MIGLTKWAENFIVLPTTNKLIKFEPHQTAILDHAFKFDKNGKLPYSVIVYSCPKKSGKTAICSILMAYWLYNIEAPNEILTLANKRDQALARGYRELRGYLQRNPVLMREAVKFGEKLIELRNGSIVQALPNDFAGEAGSNHGLTVWDELWGYTSERDNRLFDELTPVPTRKNSIRFIATYAGFSGESVLLEDIYHQIFDPQDNVLDDVQRPLGDDFPCYTKGEMFCYWDNEPRMPWQTAQYYASQKQQLRTNTYLRLHENRWVSSESSMFNMESWDKCVDPYHKPPLPNKEIYLRVGCDASVKKDRSAVVSVYRDGDAIKLGPKRFWQPTSQDPMDLEQTMEAYLLYLYKNYTLLSVLYDPFQFHRSATTLLKKGLPMREFPQTVGNLTAIGQNIYDLVEYGNIVLYPCKDMRFEATCSIGKNTGRGVRLIKEKTSAKIDQIVSLAMAAIRAVSDDKPLFPGI